MRTNFVLVDFENVQPTDLHLLHGQQFKIHIFLGAGQTKIPVELACALQAFGTDAEYVQGDGPGRNALDFHITYYLGRLVATHPDAFFHIISKDTGFDPLIAHLKRQRVFCQRSASIADIPMFKLANARSVAAQVEAVIADLVKRKAAKPRTRKTLSTTIQALFANRLSPEELEQLLAQLSTRGVITVSNDKIAYALPG